MAVRGNREGIEASTRRLRVVPGLPDCRTNWPILRVDCADAASPGRWLQPGRNWLRAPCESFPTQAPHAPLSRKATLRCCLRSSSVMSMTHLVSRRMFVSASSAIAAGFVSGVPLLARSEQQRRGAEPGAQLTAGMIDFHVHTAPDTAQRTVPPSRRRERHSTGDCERLFSKALRSKQSPGRLCAASTTFAG